MSEVDQSLQAKYQKALSQIQSMHKDNSEMKVIYDPHYLDWKANDLLLDNVTVTEAAKVLEEMYKVTITINDSSVSSQRFTATFPGTGSLDQALKSICEFNGCTYHYDKNNAAITILNTKHKNVTN